MILNTHLSKRSILCIMSYMMLAISAYTQSPLETVKKVADKIIADTRFEYTLVPQQEVLGVQVVDGRFLSPGSHEFIYAIRTTASKKDTTIRFGINSSAAVKIWINKKLVYEQAVQPAVNPKEIAYDRFQFQQHFTAAIRKGNNKLMVQTEGSGTVPVIFRAVTEKDYLDTTLSFAASPAWLFAGPFQEVVAPDILFADLPAFNNIQGKIFTWQNAPQRFIPELVTDKKAAYQRDPYADWQYAHGTMVWSIYQLGITSGESSYTSFVKNYTDFALKNMDYFRWQYDSLYAFRGSYHRIFRRTMLDDGGAPALPFMSVYLDQRDTALNRIVYPIMDYIAHGQTRLADGTFCRPEPVEYTVWCDDLFMSVPLLLQMAAITGDKKYYDDAAKQAINFSKYLLDPATGLYAHGWFSTTQSRSPVFWGRADGWIAWALAELLEKLPVKHPSYKTILKNYQQYMAVLARYQSNDGMWHQVLNNPDSYEETSCTAMFSLTMARGVRLGWLPASYKEKARKGWAAVASHITADGVVHGICRGTDMGYDQQFYMDRKTIDNDPRGLGAVISAGVEVSKLK